MMTSAGASIRLREMATQDLSAAHALSREAQWPHRLEDWSFMLRLGLGVVAELDGSTIGTAMAWPYGANAANLGMVIVSPNSRGAGVGQMLMNAMFDRLGERTIILNATDGGLPLYKKLGFKAVGGIHRHQGTVLSVPIVSLRRDERVRPMGMGDKTDIIELDREAGGMERADLLSSLLKTAQGVVLAHDGKAVGFAFFRRFGLGYAIGPVVAPDAQGAKALISHWLGFNAGSFMRVDVPYNSGLPDWLEDLGVPAAGRGVTMVRGEPLARTGSVATFAIASQAFG